MKNVVEIPQRQNYHVTQQFHSWVFNCKKKKNQKDTHTKVHGSTVYNSHDTEATKKSIDRGLGKEDVVHTEWDGPGGHCVKVKGRVHHREKDGDKGNPKSNPMTRPNSSSDDKDTVGA